MLFSCFACIGAIEKLKYIIGVENSYFCYIYIHFDIFAGNLINRLIHLIINLSFSSKSLM